MTRFKEILPKVLPTGAELYDDAMDLAEDLDELPLGDTLYSDRKSTRLNSSHNA